MAEEHAAKKWVEERFPGARASMKAMLILTYGAGFDAGMAEAESLIEATVARFIAEMGKQNG